jgi:hypothetical protein
MRSEEREGIILYDAAYAHTYSSIEAPSTELCRSGRSQLGLDDCTCSIVEPTAPPPQQHKYNAVKSDQ